MPKQIEHNEWWFTLPHLFGVHPLPVMFTSTGPISHVLSRTSTSSYHLWVWTMTQIQTMCSSKFLHVLCIFIYDIWEMSKLGNSQPDVARLIRLIFSSSAIHSPAALHTCASSAWWSREPWSSDLKLVGGFNTPEKY